MYAKGEAVADARWRTIEHTADLGLEVEAPTLEQLFVTCAHGLAGVTLGSHILTYVPVVSGLPLGLCPKPRGLTLCGQSM